MASKRYKLPEDPRRRKQVKTFIKRNGRDAYSKIGSRNGKPTPASFDSERGRQAALKMHALRRERLAAEKEIQDNENNQPIGGDSET